MISVDILNRPFSSDLITGLMLPDGIFESSLGKQRVNAQFSNVGASPVNNTTVFVESVSHPGIVITPATNFVGSLAGGATRVLSWEADFSAAPPGVHRISFIAENAAGRVRRIKKIFVTRVQFDPATLTFSAQTPEGLIQVRLKNLVTPDDECCGRKRRPRGERRPQGKGQSLLDQVGRLFRGHEPDFKFCPPGYLLKDLEVVVMPTPGFSGQYGDLPFQDPWWKVLLCIIAVILLIAASIVAATSGEGEVIVTTGGGDGDGDENCCGVGAEGGSSSYVVAGLVAAAAAAATAAGLLDVRDPFRRGQDNTVPAAGEVTTGERLDLSLSYPEPVALGRPFAVSAKWEYTRFTTGASYSFAVNETNPNVHIISGYEITAPDVVRLYRREPFIVRAQFTGEDGKFLRGGQLFVQCFLAGPQGQHRSFRLQDDGVSPDEKANDGVYTGVFFFPFEKTDPRGIWKYFVIAQDVNNAQPNMEPEEAATIIGGMVVTHQLTISFGGGECEFVPDGHVNVV